MLIRNHAGRCHFSPPPWKIATRPLESGQGEREQYRFYHPAKIRGRRIINNDDDNTGHETSHARAGRRQRQSHRQEAAPIPQDRPVHHPKTLVPNHDERPPHGKERHRSVLPRGNVLHERQAHRPARLRLRIPHPVEGTLLLVPHDHARRSLHDELLLVGRVGGPYHAKQLGGRGGVGRDRGHILRHTVPASEVAELVGHAGAVAAGRTDARDGGEGRAVGAHDGQRGGGVFQVYFGVVLRRGAGEADGVRRHGFFDVELVRGEEYRAFDAGGDGSIAWVCHGVGVQDIQ
mmetsp:Transcript_12351/g.30205  ORF Transcript_12351/g.30205 Transcript_12351/m.30205 type:complete len:290 (-) Transcript_12351:2093-2962(-)